MPAIDVVIESGIELSMKARQVCGMFDCPPEEKQRLEWKADLPIEQKKWNVGLIVGPSGSGKSTVASHLWPNEIKAAPVWNHASVIDSFDGPISETASTLNSVGFSTIPAWLRPYHVLSNGEKFRVDMARRISDAESLIVVDEFTSVVDRQVAKIASNSIQKLVRRKEKQFVAISCHDDVIDWLQPDWIFRPDERVFAWRSVQPRPRVEVQVARISREAWSLFAPFHYMNADLHRAAQCFGLWIGDKLAAFIGCMHKPHPKAKNLKVTSRIVTFPDFQGLGLGFHLSETIGAAYKAVGMRFRNYPAHPAFIRSYKPDRWQMMKRAGTYSHNEAKPTRVGADVHKQRPCAVMEYVGQKMPIAEARRLLAKA